MLLKLLMAVAAIFSPLKDNDIEPPIEFTPTAYGPQTPEEADIARKALHGKHFGGDIVLPDGWNHSDTGKRDRGNVRWPGYPGRGVVPFVIDGEIAHHTPLILEAMDQFRKFTCIRFVRRTTETDFIRIFSGLGCWSKLGRVGGEQFLSLGLGCMYIGTIVHELGHALGFFHEHQRHDRDDYLYVFLENVERGYLHNFQKNKRPDEIISTTYNYDSIMHYGNFAFSKEPNRLYTMRSRILNPLKEPYEKPGLDKTDMYQVNHLYKCPN